MGVDASMGLDKRAVKTETRNSDPITACHFERLNQVRSRPNPGFRALFPGPDQSGGFRPDSAN